MSSNSKGNSRETRTIDYYDRLPRSVRYAVANAAFDWALHGWLLMFERRQITAKELVKRIRLADRNLATAQRRKVWGTDYPVLKGALRS